LRCFCQTEPLLFLLHHRPSSTAYVVKNRISLLLIVIRPGIGVGVNFVLILFFIRRLAFKRPAGINGFIVG